MQRQISVLIIVILFAMVFGVFVVSAQTAAASSTSSNSPNRTEIRTRVRELRELQNKQLTAEERAAKIAEIRGIAQADRCSLVKRNIEARVDFYSDNKDAFTTRFNLLLTNLDAGIKRLKALGKDTRKLEALYTKISTAVSDVRAEYLELEKQLEAANVSACTFTTGQKVSSLENAKASLKKMREANKSIAKIVKEELVPELKAVLVVSSSSSSKASSSRSSSAN